MQAYTVEQVAEMLHVSAPELVESTASLGAGASAGAADDVQSTINAAETIFSACFTYLLS